MFGTLYLVDCMQLGQSVANVIDGQNNYFTINCSLKDTFIVPFVLFEKVDIKNKKTSSNFSQTLKRIVFMFYSTSTRKFKLKCI